MTEFTVSPIGVVHSPFKEKFGIPRQPGLAPHAISRLLLLPEYATADCVDGLGGFSHLWLLFLFHATAAQGWQPRVRPPRLGGNVSTGVFASRSMFRPNPVGLSLVELVGIEDGPDGKELVLRGADLLDGTPIIDIKPYLPWADSVPDARSGYAPAPPTLFPVVWTDEARQQAQQLSPDMVALIKEVLAQDPRPAYRAGRQDDSEYGVSLERVNVRFRVLSGWVQVVQLHVDSL